MHDHLWIEKFRPQTLDEMCLSEYNRKQIKKWEESKDMPHLLLVSKPGQGKTTLARILVQNVLQCDYLYINASDESGIDTIRNKVTGFVKTKSFDGELKVVILDEGDQLTKSSLDCLRNLMESYSQYARFIITGNYEHKITEAIKSRCQSIDITPDIKDGLKRCLHILKEEEIKISPEQKKLLVSLIKRNFPDLRKCIVQMQQNCDNGILDIKNNSSKNEICDEIFKNLKSKNSLKTRKYLLENEQSFNHDYENLLKEILNYLYSYKLDDTKKKEAIVLIASYLFKATQVTDREINTFACILELEELID